MLCARRLISCVFCRTREAIAYRLCLRCEWIRTSSYLSHLQVQFACSASLFGRSTPPSLRHHLSFAANRPKKPENTDKSSFVAEKLGKDDFTESATSLEPRQGSYVRKDNLKWQKNPWRVKQLRFSRHIRNLVRKGKTEEAHEVFEQMKKDKVQPDVAVYNTLIAGYGREGNVQACFKLFNEVSLLFIYKVEGKMWWSRNQFWLCYLCIIWYLIRKKNASMFLDEEAFIAPNRPHLLQHVCRMCSSWPQVV